LAPEDGRLNLLAAVVEHERGNMGAATERLRRAVGLATRICVPSTSSPDPQETAAGAAEAQQPDGPGARGRAGNLVALLRQARLTARQVIHRLQRARRIGAASLSVPAPMSRWKAVQVRSTARPESRSWRARPGPAAYRTPQRRWLPTRLDLIVGRFLRRRLLREAPVPTSFAARPRAG
jgi:hypothetical protein